MKVNLMFQEQDFDLSLPYFTPVYNAGELTADLELKQIFQAMAGEDQTILAAAKAALLHPLTDADMISYRQAAVADCLHNPGTVRTLYQTALDALESRRKGCWWLSGRYLPSIFSSAVSLLLCYLEFLKQLRDTADAAAGAFSSEGFQRLFAMLSRELEDGYLSRAGDALRELKFRDGVLIGLRLGEVNEGVGYTLLRREKKQFWRRWTFAPSFTLAPRDDAGANDLSARRNRAMNESVDVLAQSAEHVEHFFKLLRDELAFYVGCINLSDALSARNTPICFPTVHKEPGCGRVFRGLRDVSLSLLTGKAVGNDLTARGKRLYLITGANQGGKSTFLRSIGQAQLMFQCGMFTAAEAYCSHLTGGIYTHFKKEEDSGMNSGKLDEELLRMSGIADHLHKNSLVLFNESFAATNEREGSELCRQITLALVEHDVEVFSVTHLFTFADDIFHLQRPDAVFLRAQRLEGGRRTFRILPGEPLQTAYGEDLYQKIFRSTTEPNQI